MVIVAPSSSFLIDELSSMALEAVQGMANTLHHRYGVEGIVLGVEFLTKRVSGGSPADKVNTGIHVHVHEHSHESKNQQ